MRSQKCQNIWTFFCGACESAGYFFSSKFTGLKRALQLRSSEEKGRGGSLPPLATYPAGLATIKWAQQTVNQLFFKRVPSLVWANPSRFCLWQIKRYFFWRYFIAYTQQWFTSLPSSWHLMSPFPHRKWGNIIYQILFCKQVWTRWLGKRAGTAQSLLKDF